MSKWISVEDRLPDDDSLVVAGEFYKWAPPDLAVCLFFNGSFHVCTDGLIAENYDGGAMISLDMDITHWMPLPEPPAENEE